MNDETTGTRRLGPWVAALAAVLLIAACTRRGPAVELPADLEEGAVLLTVLLAGEAPIQMPGGMEVLAIDGAWVEVEISSKEGRHRWLNFARVTACDFAP